MLSSVWIFFVKKLTAWIDELSQKETMQMHNNLVEIICTQMSSLIWPFLRYGRFILFAFLFPCQQITVLTIM